MTQLHKDNTTKKNCEISSFNIIQFSATVSGNNIAFHVVLGGTDGRLGEP